MLRPGDLTLLRADDGRWECRMIGDRTPAAGLIGLGRSYREAFAHFEAQLWHRERDAADRGRQAATALRRHERQQAMRLWWDRWRRRLQLV